MPAEEVDLIQLATGEVAQAGTGAPEIVRRELAEAGCRGRRADDIPEHLWRSSRGPTPGRTY